MLMQILRSTNMYPNSLLGRSRPSWVPARYPWPPRWAASHKPKTMVELKKFLGVLYGLGISSNRSIKDVFGNLWSTEVPWLKDVCTRHWFNGMKAALHCQPDDQPLPKVDGQVPHNAKVRKVGVLMHMFEQACISAYKISKALSLDEQTAMTNARTCFYRHIQRHKPANGIRIYSICEVGTTYFFTFMVDIKDGTSIQQFAER